MDARQFKRPESVLIVVGTAGDDVLLLRRLDPEDFWQSVTGSLRWEESPQAAAERELREETGLEPVGLVDCWQRNAYKILPAWRARYHPDVSTNVEHVFRLLLAVRPDITLNAREHAEYLWLPRDAAAAKVGSSTNRDAILAWVPGG